MDLWGLHHSLVKLRPLWGRILTGAAAVAAAGLVRGMVRPYRLLNPDLAVRQGINLTRGTRRALAITAHPDDLEFMCGGTLRLLSLAGTQITTVVLSCGARQQNYISGLWDLRRQEQRDAGVILGYGDIRFLDLGDLGLPHNPLLEPAVEQVWRETRPDLVLVFDPSHPMQIMAHPDHLTAGRVALSIHRRSAPAPDVLLYGTKQGNVLVDITETIEDKIQAVLAHRSQLRTALGAYGAAVRLDAGMSGHQAGLLYAERFRALSLPALAEQAFIGQWSKPMPGRQGSRPGRDIDRPPGDRGPQ